MYISYSNSVYKINDSNVGNDNVNDIIIMEDKIEKSFRWVE